MILFGLLLGSASLFVVSTATEFSPILLLSVVYGFGFSAVTSSTVPFVSDLVSKDSYGYAMGFISTIMDIGQTMGPIVTGILIASSGYGFSFVTLSVLLLISCAVILPVTGRRTRETG